MDDETLSATAVEVAMKVHVVLREDQNEYGFIDTSVVGLFRNRRDANAFVVAVESDDSPATNVRRAEYSHHGFGRTCPPAHIARVFHGSGRSG